MMRLLLILCLSYVSLSAQKVGVVDMDSAYQFLNRPAFFEFYRIQIEQANTILELNMEKEYATVLKKYNIHKTG